MVNSNPSDSTQPFLTDKAIAWLIINCAGIFGTFEKRKAFFNISE